LFGRVWIHCRSLCFQKSELLGLIDLEECTRIESAEAKVFFFFFFFSSWPLLLSLLLTGFHFPPHQMGAPRCFEVCTTSRTYFLIAETDVLMQAWVDTLRQVLYYFKPALAVTSMSPSLSADTSRSKKPLLEGWLTKQGGHNKSWKNRWCVLRYSLFFPPRT